MYALASSLILNELSTQVHVVSARSLQTKQVKTQGESCKLQNRLQNNTSKEALPMKPISAIDGLNSVQKRTRNK
jgi:hypothetical protein